MTMKTIFLRFPDIGDKILNSLDDESLAKSKTVCRSWSDFLEEEMFYWKRIITKYVKSPKYQEESLIEAWRVSIDKSSMEIVKELGLAVRNYQTICQNCIPMVSATKCLDLLATPFINLASNNQVWFQNDFCLI